MKQPSFKIARNGLVIGDFTIAQIKVALISGEILGSDYYYEPELKKWLHVSEKDWRLDEEKRGGSGKSFWGFGCFGVPGYIIALYIIIRLCIKSSNDSRVFGFTWFVAVFASIVYFEFRKEKRTNLSQESGGRSSRPRLLWTGYLLMILFIIITGFSFTKIGRQAWEVGRQASKDWNIQRDKFSYEVWCDFDREIFPCYEIAFAKLNDALVEKLMSPEKDEAHEFNQEKHGGSIGLRLFDVRKGDRYEIKVQSEGRPSLISESTYVFSSDQDYAHSIAYPRLNFDYAQLRAAAQTRPINLKFSVSRNGGTPILVTQTWILRQINDCPIGIRLRRLQANGVIQNTSANIAIITFAGYVNENHPSIPSILDEALSEGGLIAFNGYQEGTNLSVLRQLNAIWKALEKKGIKYSNISTTTGSSTAVQHVRLIEDTLSTRQANCVEGSTLFASIATKIGLDACLMLAPGHCFVAIEMPETGPVGIEMTMLGSDKFLDAVAMATTKADYSLRRNQKKYELSDSESGYTRVPITLCRELGIQPIPAGK